MDCTSIFRMCEPSTGIDRGGGGGGGGNTNNVNGNRSDGIIHSSRIQLHKRVKNIRLTHGQLQQQSRCKTRLVLLLLGLWMNLIAVTNGKWKHTAC